MKALLVSAIVAASALVASTASATQAWVGHSALNARSGPGTYYDKLGTFRPCTAVHVVAYQNGWAKVWFDNRNYWVSAKYLRGHSCKPAYKPAHKPHYQAPYSHKPVPKPSYGY